MAVFFHLCIYMCVCVCTSVRRMCGECRGGGGMVLFESVWFELCGGKCWYEMRYFYAASAEDRERARGRVI